MREKKQPTKKRQDKDSVGDRKREKEKRDLYI